MIVQPQEQRETSVFYKRNLDSNIECCTIILTEPTTPLIFMRNPVGLSAECYDKHFAIFILIKNSHLFTYNRTIRTKKSSCSCAKMKVKLIRRYNV